ncbi:TATA-binding protein associated factor Taf2 [Schizosaccharomyces pombe]|uniref:Transcription initiation factor TFIID subunit 2 n=1 Tax=Schizosaccharomyces pombe (strain 972 / ATCC 24843) TaxID=284812 RepID=TAF2_SCHPO|nr:putative TATA-binding protein-associated factor Taf2 [Schizosaccharomyces pombe]P87121.3 RecName: Full=Transcription initiation factor TFIID subunit 2; AltName: Full=TBP-associated factor 2 [Schizosaccharomyces pombe 972h-]CAB08750.3 TATA-binding protein associated factor Taf2 (predicted) [Schizosaccharomyces pombe]|eukprot:NP_593331.2 putative TATA-binding protein-associated factor Taf2 [Schizosaccharomyces pombe]
MSQLVDVPARGHQKVAIDIDFASQTIIGRTDITVNPIDSNLQKIVLDCYQAEIHSVYVNGDLTKFSYSDALKKLRIDEPNSTVNQHHQLNLQYEALMNDLGGINIFLSKPPGDELRPLIVSIDFSVHQPIFGITFVGIDPVDHRYPHVFTNNSIIPYSTCSWLPCVDGIWERSTWEFEITLPKTLSSLMHREKTQPSDLNNGANGVDGHDDNYENNRFDHQFNLSNEPDLLEDHDIEVICCGDLLDQVTHPKDMRKKTVYFSVTTPVAPNYIAFAAGPFKHINLTDFREPEDDDAMGSSAIDITGYYLPKYAEEVENTCVFLYKAMDFFVREYGSYPFNSFKLCFVDETNFPIISTPSLVISSNSILYPKDSLDQIYDSTKTLTWALASQWIGVYLIPKAWSDLWLIYGLSYYICGLFLKKLMGNNDYRFRLKKQVYRLLELDIGKPPISQRNINIPIDPNTLDFIALKSPLVIHILERRLTKTGGSLGMSRVIPKLLLQVMSGDMLNGCLSTSHFLKTCEKASHMRLDVFAQQWIYGYGYPIFRVVQRFNRKKMIIEMGIDQVQTKEAPRAPMSDKNFLSDAIRHLNNESIPTGLPVFSGPMTIRIHEADGTPYEHVVELKDSFTKLDIQYNTKYKRISRNRSTKNVKRDGDHNGDDSDYVIRSLGDVLQSDEDIERWHLYDYTKEEEDTMATEAFEWIRVDADFEWICDLRVRQPEHMYVSQLQQDRDVVAQLETIRHFTSESFTVSQQVSTVLLRTLLDNRYYYGIRQEAARALARCAIPELDWVGYYHLRMAYLEKFCFKDSTIPKSNDFSNITEYYVKCAMLESFPNIRDRKGVTPSSVKKLLLDLLCYNDNANNEFSDAYFICLLIDSLVEGLIPRGETVQYAFSDPEHMEFVNQVINEIDRYMRIDACMPSFKNIITCKSLKAKLRLAQTFHLEFGPKELLPYTQEGNYVLVRCIAFNLMLQAGALKYTPLIKYIFYILTNDLSPVVRRSLLYSVQDGLGALARGGTKSDVASEDLIVEEDITKAVEKRIDITSRASISGAIEALRNDLGQNHDFATEIWNAINNPKSDLLTKRNLLMICRVLYKAKSSLLVTLKIPSLIPRLRAIHLGKGKIVIKKAPLKQITSKTKEKSTSPTPPSITINPIKPKGPTLKIKLTNLRSTPPSH